MGDEGKASGGEKGRGEEKIVQVAGDLRRHPHGHDPVGDVAQIKVESVLLIPLLVLGDRTPSEARRYKGHP